MAKKSVEINTIKTLTNAIEKIEQALRSMEDAPGTQRLEYLILEIDQTIEKLNDNKLALQEKLAETDEVISYVIFYQDSHNLWHTDLLNMYEDNLVKATELFHKRACEEHKRVELIKETYDQLTGEIRSETLQVYENTCAGCDNHCNYSMCHREQ